MSDLIKNQILQELTKNKLIEAGLKDLEIGSIYIKRDTIIKIREINSNKDGDIRIYYDKARDWACKTWSSYGSDSPESFERNGYYKLTKSIEEHVEEAQKLIKGEISISDYGDEQEDDEINENTALISRSSKDSLIALKNAMETKKQSAELLQAFVNFEMEKKRSELESIMRTVSGVVAVWQKKIAKVMRIIATIELYLGVNEDIFQIQEGEKAPQTTPISFRQLVLFMDEEVANTDEGGLDFQDVHKFDAWLIENNNYKKLLPEEKGVVVFRPRRYFKEYGKDDRDAYAKNKENTINTYILIRNGECLYRINTDNLVILDRLFPRKTELEDLLKETAKIESRYSKEEAKEKVNDEFYQYKKRAILMQGLIDRTDILHPLPVEGLSMFNLEGTEKFINFIYDDEPSLTDGRTPFTEWKKQINSKISYGSRIVLSPNWRTWGETSKDIVEDRSFKYYSNKYSIPASPKEGLYEVEKHQERLIKFFFDRNSEKTKKEIEEGNWKFLERRNANCDKYYKMDDTIHMVIKYNPGGEVWKGWGHGSEERKNRIAFKIFNEDGFILNYDQISLEDIEYYLNNRCDRRNYLDMMPLLRTMKKWRLEEIQNEKNFAIMVLGELIKLYPKISEDNLKLSIDELIEWWKFKNMIKRPIDKDDSKALRMIIKEFQRNNK